MSFKTFTLKFADFNPKIFLTSTPLKLILPIFIFFTLPPSVYSVICIQFSFAKSILNSLYFSFNLFIKSFLLISTLELY